MTSWLLRNSLWLAALALAAASSGLDGCYMATWMPESVAWLGYVLNTVADLSGLAIMYNYGRLQQTRLNEAGGKRKRKLSRVLLVAEGVTVLYSAFFSWRQLRIVLPATEPTDWPWVALVSAGFVPLLLAAIGYTQALLAGRFEEERLTKTAQTAETDTETITEIAQVTVAPSDNGKDRPYKICALCGFTAQSPQAWAGHCKGAQHKRNVAEAAPVLTEL